MTSPRPRRLERWVPGVRVARTYERRWLRADLVAGIVLAAILVPQGMAYAELAGLPPVTGLYTTIACLVGYAIFGPSRVLVLGPDSSVSPLIFAAIVPLLVDGRPGDRHRSRRDAGPVRRPHRDRLGLGKLGFVADLLSKEVQVGYMNGLAITIIVGQLPKLFGFSTDADGFIDEVKAFVTSLDQTERDDARRRRWPASPVLLVLPRFTRRVPAVLVAVVGATVVVGGARPRRAGREDGRRPAPGRAHAGLPVDELQRRRPAAHRRRRHHARVAHRHHRHVDELRRPARRRGRPRPGDDRHGRRQHRRRVLPGLRDLDQRLAHGGGRAVRRQEPGHRPGRRRPRPRAPALPQRPARRPAPDDAGRRRDRRRALADGLRASCAATTGCARARWCSRSSPPSASILFGVL